MPISVDSLRTKFPYNNIGYPGVSDFGRAVTPYHPSINSFLSPWGPTEHKGFYYYGLY